MILTIDSNFLGHPTNEAVRNKNTCNPWELPITHWNLSSLLKMGIFQPAMFVYRRVPLPRGMLLLLVSGIRKSFSRGGPFLLEDSPDLCEEVLRRLGAQKTRRALWESRLRFFFSQVKKQEVSFLGRKRTSIPKQFIYGIFTYMSLIFMVYMDGMGYVKLNMLEAWKKVMAVFTRDWQILRVECDWSRWSRLEYSRCKLGMVCFGDK